MEVIPLFDTSELITSCEKLKNKKAPGPDGTIPDIFTKINKEIPKVVLNIMNNILCIGEYPKFWKQTDQANIT